MNKKLREKSQKFLYKIPMQKGNRILKCGSHSVNIHRLKIKFKGCLKNTESR